MRITVWPSTLIAAAVALAAARGASSPATIPTYAAIAHSLTASDFHEVALQGWGDRANSYAWTMGWYGDRLYVGDNRNYSCATLAMWMTLVPLPYPPSDPDVQCPGNPPVVQDLPPTLGAEIWALNPTITSPLTQSDWTMVYQSPITVPMTVGDQLVMGPRDIAFRGMSVFNDVNGQRSLYVSGVGAGNTITLSSVPPPSLLRSSDGIHFTPVPADPGTTLGNINKAGCCFRGQTTYDGKFIVVIGTIQGAGAVFSSTDPRVGDNNFLQITPSNMQVFEIEPFNGHLYLGVQSLFGGYEVLRTDCVTPPADQKGCPMSDFTTVVPPGGGLGSKGNFSITSMHVFTDTNGVPHLYVGTNGAPQGMPAEIVRINQDDSWDLVVGTPRLVNGVLKSPLSGLGQGFGWPFNWHMWRMEDYQGILYVGTFDASTIYRNSSIGSQLLPYMGFDLWASRDGRTFLPVSINGFGDKFSFGARSLTATPYGLFVGSANYYYGLRIWQGKLSPDALHLAPTNLRPMPAAAPTSVALTWDAPSTATLFHVYRATERRQTIPSLSDAEAASIGLVNRRPQLTWMPGAFTEVGTTTARSFRDRGAWAGGHYIYYVVAQDAEGNLSAASNAIAMPALMPAQ